MKSGCRNLYQGHLLKFSKCVTKVVVKRIFTYEMIRKQKPHIMSTERNYRVAKWLMGISACTILVFGLMSFQDSARKNPILSEKSISPSVVDSPPEKIEINIPSEEINKAMKELGEALGQVGKELKKVDWNKIGKDVEISLKEVNIEKIMSEVREAISKVDVPKIRMEIEQEMKKTDGRELQKEIEKEIQQGLKEFDNFNWKEMQEALKGVEIEVKDFDKEKFKAEMEKMKPVLKEKMEELKQELKKLEKEKKKAEKSGYACKDKCKKAKEAEVDFVPYVPLEPMI
jgi:hypothetical protein